MIENYTFSASAKINMDERGIKTSHKINLFPLNLKPASNIGVVDSGSASFFANSRKNFLFFEIIPTSNMLLRGERSPRMGPPPECRFLQLASTTLLKDNWSLPSARGARNEMLILLSTKGG